MDPAAELRSRVAGILPRIVELRHAFHAIPETHYEEQKTAAAIRGYLAGSRIELLPPLVGTDTVGLLRGGLLRGALPRGALPGPCILLRADIDALPLEEKTGAPWISTHPGRAHACGHDGHIAMLLGAATVLEAMADRLAGSVRFVFQPAEEKGRGGRDLVEKGLLDTEPRPGAAFALHGWVGMPVGTLSAAPGAMMAAADRFVLTVTGRGGHAALPHRTADPVVAAAAVVTGLQTVASRLVDPLEPVVVSVCRIEGGHSSNVIPDQVVLEGTTRYFDRSLEGPIREHVRRVAEGICEAHGCACELLWSDGYIPLVNHASAVTVARAAVTRYLSADSWLTDHPRTMGAEDFAFYLEKVPGALLRLGLGEDWPRLHSSGFDFNDRALEPGILALAGLALDFCGR